jgi:hypothetical protein
VGVNIIDEKGLERIPDFRLSQQGAGRLSVSQLIQTDDLDGANAEFLAFRSNESFSRIFSPYHKDEVRTSINEGLEAYQ